MEIRRDREGEIISATLKLSDKIKALELLGRYHKLFNEKVDVNLGITDWRVLAIKNGVTEEDVVNEARLLIEQFADDSSCEESN